MDALVLGGQLRQFFLLFQIGHFLHQGVAHPGNFRRAGRFRRRVIGKAPVTLTGHHDLWHCRLKHIQGHNAVGNPVLCDGHAHQRITAPAKFIMQFGGGQNQLVQSDMFAGMAGQLRQRVVRGNQ